MVSGSLLISAIPFYLLVLLADFYLVQMYQVFPPTGYYSPLTEGPVKWVGGVLPWLMIGIGSATVYARFSRGSMIEALDEDYVRGGGP